MSANGLPPDGQSLSQDTQQDTIDIKRPTQAHVRSLFEKTGLLNVAGVSQSLDERLGKREVIEDAPTVIQDFCRTIVRQQTLARELAKSLLSLNTLGAEGDDVRFLFSNDIIKVKRLSAKGAFGDIWLVSHGGEPRVLKIMKTPTNKEDVPNVTKRFRREAKLLEQNQGDGTPQLYPQETMPWGEYQGNLYYLMEYCAGRDLASFLRSVNSVSVERRPCMDDLSLLLCVAVMRLHGEGREGGNAFIHRDLKPDNIHIGDDGQLRILDLGLSKSLKGSQTNLTQDAILGTPAYMAPEQFRNASGVDTSADVYALGCILHEIHTGGRPYGGADFYEFMSRHTGSEYPDLKSLEDAGGPGLRVMIRRMIDKDRDKRPEAYEVAEFFWKRSSFQREGAAKDFSSFVHLPPSARPLKYVRNLPKGQPGDVSIPSVADDRSMLRSFTDVYHPANYRIEAMRLRQRKKAMKSGGFVLAFTATVVGGVAGIWHWNNRKRTDPVPSIATPGLGVQNAEKAPENIQKWPRLQFTADETGLKELVLELGENDVLRLEGSRAISGFDGSGRPISETYFLSAEDFARLFHTDVTLLPESILAKTHLISNFYFTDETAACCLSINGVAHIFRADDGAARIYGTSFDFEKTPNGILAKYNRSAFQGMLGKDLAIGTYEDFKRDPEARDFFRKNPTDALDRVEMPPPDFPMHQLDEKRRKYTNEEWEQWIRVTTKQTRVDMGFDSVVTQQKSSQ